MGLQYRKTAMVLWLLRDNVLGAKRFDDAFKEKVKLKSKIFLKEIS